MCRAGCTYGRFNPLLLPKQGETHVHVDASSFDSPFQSAPLAEARGDLLCEDRRMRRKV